MSTAPAAPADKFLVLLVEDDPAIARLIAAHLIRNGLAYHHACDGKSGLAAFHSLQPHLVLLDIMMPDLDGRAVCAEIRTRSAVPIIMLTAKNASEDQVRSFKCGADDYVTKPFEPALLMARVAAQLRRVYRYDAPVQALQPPEWEMPGLEEPALESDCEPGETVSAPAAVPLFSVADEPYTLADIAAVLGIPYKRVQHSRWVLEQRSSTQAKVRPLDRGRPLHFSAATADLIARHCRHPKRS